MKIFCKLQDATLKGMIETCTAIDKGDSFITAWDIHLGIEPISLYVSALSGCQAFINSLTTKGLVFGVVGDALSISPNER